MNDIVHLTICVDDGFNVFFKSAKFIVDLTLIFFGDLVFSIIEVVLQYVLP